MTFIYRSSTFYDLYITELCPDVCPQVNEPVCGSDGQTYSNRCELGREACTNNENLRTLYAGACAASKCIFYTFFLVYFLS